VLVGLFLLISTVSSQLSMGVLSQSADFCVTALDATRRLREHTAVAAYRAHTNRAYEGEPLQPEGRDGGECEPDWDRPAGADILSGGQRIPRRGAVKRRRVPPCATIQTLPRARPDR
jgi:hypothetical protein